MGFCKYRCSNLLSIECEHSLCMLCGESVEATKMGLRCCGIASVIPEGDAVSV